MIEPSEGELALFDDMCRAALGDVNNHIWTKSDGTRIHVSNMSTEHIQNCIAMLERDGYSRNAKDRSYTTWFGIFEEELRIRQVKI